MLAWSSLITAATYSENMQHVQSNEKDAVTQPVGQQCHLVATPVKINILKSPFTFLKVIYDEGQNHSLQTLFFNE